MNIELELEVIKDGCSLSRSQCPLPATFGKLKECTFCLDHPSISRKHAQIYADLEGNVILHDLGSVHGTFVNKKRVDSVPLRDGDQVRFGLSSRIYIVHIAGVEENVVEGDGVQEIEQCADRLNSPISLHSASSASSPKSTQHSTQSAKPTQQPHPKTSSISRLLARQWLEDRGYTLGKEITIDEPSLPKTTFQGTDPLGQIERFLILHSEVEGDFCDAHEAQHAEKRRKRAIEAQCEEFENDLYDLTTNCSLIEKKPRGRVFLTARKQVIVTQILEVQRDLLKCSESPVESVGEVDELEEFVANCDSTLQREKIGKLKCSLQRLIEESVEIERLLSLLG